MNNERTFKEIDHITFKTEMFTHRFQYFEDNKKSFVAFEELRTHQQIKVFDLEANYIKTIPLHGLIKLENETFVKSYIISLDSLLLLSMFTNKIYLVDDSGTILQKTDYSYLQKEGIELWDPLFYHNSTFYCSIMYSNPNYSDNFETKDWHMVNDINLPFSRVFVDSNFRKQDSIHNEIITHFRSRFGKRNEQLIEPNRICFTSNKLILSSGYSDSLYIYNYSGELIKIVPIISDYTNARIKPPTFKECAQNPKLINQNFLDFGFISTVVFDEYRNIYYCKVRHQAKEGERPFSLVILDTSFKKMDEVAFTEDQYYSSYFIGKKGLYLLKKTENQFKESLFTIFNYE